MDALQFLGVLGFAGSIIGATCQVLNLARTWRRHLRRNRLARA